MSIHTTELGKVSLTFEGEYDSSATYDKNCCVLFQGSTYVTLHSGVSGLEPNNDGVNWRLLASGSVGPKGAQGVQGKQGVQGVQGERGPAGGYYIPSIDSNGILTWSVSNSSVSPISTSVNLKSVNANIFYGKMPPANPVDGIIWIQNTTDSAVGNDIVELKVTESVTEPVNKKNGDIWIQKEA